MLMVIVMKRILIFLLVCYAYPIQADWAGAMSGLGEALEDLSERKLREQRAEEQIRLQHQLEMERIERMEQMQIRLEQERERRQIQDEADLRQLRRQILETNHPDWEDVLYSDKYHEWKSKLSQDTQNYLKTLDDDVELSRALTAYKKWLGEQRYSVK